MYHIFYCCYSTDLEVSADEPVKVQDKDQLLDFAFDTLRDPEDFFGIVDADDNTCQFYVEETGEIWVEIPVPAEGGSYGKRITDAELEETILGLNDRFSVKMLPDLEFQSW